MEANMSDIRIIKKYPNRRLYDTEIGAYITLDAIKQLVLDRINFQVIDARSQKDLTQSTLLQIISEQEATATPLFSTSLLQDFIRSYHQKSQHVFTEYLEQAMHLFLHQKNFFQDQWLNYQKVLGNPAMMQEFIKQTSTVTVSSKSDKPARSKSDNKK